MTGGRALAFTFETLSFSRSGFSNLVYFYFFLSAFNFFNSSNFFNSAADRLGAAISINSLGAAGVGVGIGVGSA
jgi:hypothetical protein